MRRDALGFEIELRQALQEVACATDLPPELYDWYERTAVNLGIAEIRDRSSRQLQSEPLNADDLAKRAYEGFRAVLPEWVFTAAREGIH